jgi:glycosyltransferase involved in cell wall biosynthesis
MAPSVSVIVTAHNHEHYIAPAIQSVLDQTYSDYEIIVVDDGSTDGTLEQAARFERSITLVHQDPRGVAGSRDAGIERARGRLLAFLDGDDLWEPEKLAQQVAAATAHPTAGLIATDGVQFSDATVLAGSLYAPAVCAMLAQRDSVTRWCYEEFLEKNLISSTSQIMVPRPVFDVVGLSDHAFPIVSDWDLYLRIAARYEVTFLAAKLARWRYLPTSASGSVELRHLRWAPDEIAILKKHLRCCPPAARSLIRTRLSEKIHATANAAYDFGRTVDRAFAARYLLALLRKNPTSHAPALCLVGLYVPPTLTRAAGKRLRRILRLPRPDR